MGRLFLRALLLAFLGALASVICLIAAYVRHPALTLEMDRDLPPLARGFHPVERHQAETFAWTRPKASIAMAGMRRTSAWTCRLRFRGGRPEPFPQPLVTVAIEGVTRVSRQATNEYQDVEFDVPMRPSESGLTITIDSSPFFVPSPSDPRQLGVQVDRFECQPIGLTWPPRAAISAAGLSGSATGVALAFIGLPLPAAAAGVLLMAAGQAIPLSTTPAPYSPDYLQSIPRLTFWVGLVCVLGAAIAERWRRQPLHAAAAAALAISAGTLLLELLALLHPGKQVVDAAFHAHRFQGVLGGGFYFTQTMPDGVQFPYAIALYLVSAPWSLLTSDHIALLRIVVSASRAVAGLLLYPLIVRAWGERGTAVLAVALFHFVPVSFGVIGNANLTYAFGQSVATMALAATATWTLGTLKVARMATLFLVFSVAFLSHVGIFPLLLTVLVLTAALYYLLGGPVLRSTARSLLAVGTLAAVFSVVSYYGQFGESYKSLERVRARITGSAAPAPANADEAVSILSPAAAPRDNLPIRIRAIRALKIAPPSFGWPILLLAGIGVSRLWARGVRDPLALMLIACGITYLAFVGFSVASPVEPRFLRYAEEFIGRVNHAITPAVVILTACGATRAWNAGIAGRLISGALLTGATAVGVQEWLKWLE